MISLSDMDRKRKKLPPKFLLHGHQGMGKSLLASGFNNPLFLNFEDRLEHILDADSNVKDVKNVGTVENILGYIKMLTNEEHDRKTLVLDTVDWMEAVVRKHVCNRHNKTSIGEFEWGAGYDEVLKVFADIFDALTNLRDARGMTIIGTAHSKHQRYDPPTGRSYERIDIACHKRVAALCVQWFDFIGFIDLDVFVSEEDVGFNKKRKTAGGGQNRRLHFETCPAWVSKQSTSAGNLITEPIFLSPDPKVSVQSIRDAMSGAKKQEPLQEAA